MENLISIKAYNKLVDKNAKSEETLQRLISEARVIITRLESKDFTSEGIAFQLKEALEKAT